MALRDRGDVGGAGLIAGALVISAAIISWGQQGPPRYQLAASDSAIVRLDTDSGEMIACTLQGCRQVEQPDRAKSFGPLTIQFGDDRRTVETRRNVDVQQNRDTRREVEQRKIVENGS